MMVVENEALEGLSHAYYNATLQQFGHCLNRLASHFINILCHSNRATTREACLDPEARLLLEIG